MTKKPPSKRTVDSSRLGAYLLPGRIKDPLDAIIQAEAGERIGLGTMWVSERWGNKDIGAICGAVTQVAPSATIAAGTTHFLTRHPAVLASMAMTLQALSNSKFILGIGRGIPEMFQAIGLPAVSFEHTIDSINIHRKLCRGEKVNYSGILGTYSDMQLLDLPEVSPPSVILGAVGPKALQLAGAHFDGVILHPFLTPEGVSRCRNVARDAARNAGRDPDSIRIYATVVLAADLSTDEEDRVIGSRAVTYFQSRSIAKMLVEFNSWDKTILPKLWSHPIFEGVKASADQGFTLEELVEVSRTLPREWLESAAAVGSKEKCVLRLDEYLAAGADDIIIHGSTPEKLGPTLKAFTNIV
ncbi:TIGR03857 family LLM class F420-dependent oxidoreductase [Gammaproteobacteria bacterium]|nr:TIGR03857 family LLM class F420-dependent oxidoreductase [Gammaproteobacteria bacterium]